MLASVIIAPTHLLLICKIKDCLSCFSIESDGLIIIRRYHNIRDVGSHLLLLAIICPGSGFLFSRKIWNTFGKDSAYVEGMLNKELNSPALECKVARDFQSLAMDEKRRHIEVVWPSNIHV
jgi:hypothetical protein